MHDCVLFVNIFHYVHILMFQTQAFFLYVYTPYIYIYIYFLLGSFDVHLILNFG